MNSLMDSARSAASRAASVVQIMPAPATTTTTPIIAALATSSRLRATNLRSLYRRLGGRASTASLANDRSTSRARSAVVA